MKLANKLFALFPLLHQKGSEPDRIQDRVDSKCHPECTFKYYRISIVNLPNLAAVAMLSAAVAMLSAAVVVVPIQQASAQDTSFSFRQRQSNECSGFAGCSNTGIITFALPRG